MLRAAVSNWWQTHRIYHTQAHPEIWVGFVLTGLAFFKLSYGGKKKIGDSKKSHH